MSDNVEVEDLENMLPYWISDHLGEISYMTTEINTITQGELDRLRKSCSFPSGIQIRLLEVDETIASTRLGDVAFYEVAFQAGLRFSIHPTIMRLLAYYNICPAQLAPNAWQSIIGAGVLWQFHKFALSLNEFRNLFGLFNNPKPNSGWLYFKARPKKTLLGRYHSKRCNVLPALTETEQEMFDLVLGTLERGQFYPIKDVLRSKSFLRIFALDSEKIVSSGGYNAEDKPSSDMAHIAGDKAMSKKIDMKKFAQMAKGMTSVVKDMVIEEGPIDKAPVRSKATSNWAASKAATLIATPGEGTLTNPGVDLGLNASISENAEVADKLLQGLNLLAD
ncbi:hypothetical protein Acr_16g0001000 [Actinidia rufa]|uniref:Transposase (putative) gypsy type domain-containing protein n=1 Tax=Actinidia rufa TaxID=165716 RepID=A0A7J0FXT1_9ERIC|nr:hypothetical protein Acr_16g0001000 [Actinidia rufa]